MKHVFKSFWNLYSTNTYLSIFVFFWALFALTNSGFDNSEGLFHYQVAVQIIKHGQLGFDILPEGIFQEAPNGRFYAGHEIGNTLFMLPTALINVLLENIFSKFVSQELIENLQQFILSFQAGVYSAITTTTFFAILKIGFFQATIPSFIATLCLSLTTYFWSYSRNLFDGVLGATLLTLSFLFLLRYFQKSNLWYLFSCCICLGFGLITRLSMILVVLVTFAYLVSFLTSHLAFRIKEILLALLTLMPFIIWQMWYNYLRTGVFYKSPLQTPIYAENNALDGNIFVGITGLLLSPGKSLFVYAPLLILSVFLFRKFYHEYPKEAIYVAALTVLWLLLHSRLRSWYGAWGWGSRHFVTILPIMFLPFSVYLADILKNTALRMVAIFLGSFGFILGLCSIISNWHFRMMYAEQRGLLIKDRFVWSLWNNQFVDMLESGFGNLVRMITHAPIITVKNYSEANDYASSTINIWANSLIHAGVPWYIVVLLVTPLLILMYLSLQNILRNQPLKPSKKLTADG